MVFGFTADHTIFAVLSASETDSYSKEIFSTGGLRFDVFSLSRLKGAHSRVLSLLALSLKNSMILGCESATSSEFRGMIRVTFLDLMIRGGVEDTRLEAKVKDIKKIRGQGQVQPFREQNLSRPRTGMLEAKDQGPRTHAQAFSKKKGFKIFFQAISNSLAYPKFLIGGSLNHKSHEMKSSKIFPR